jgi:hypothetical protein
MTEAAAAVPDPEPTLEELVAAQNVLLERLLAVFAEANRIAGRPMTQDDRNVVVMLARRGADIEGEMFQVKDQIRKGAARRSLEQAREIMAAQIAPAAEPRPRRSRHRAPRGSGQRPLYPRSLKGFVPLGAAVTAARHSWPAAHPVVAGTIATAAVGIAATTAAVVPGGAATFGFGSPAGPPAPAASVWSAVPVTGPSQIASAVTHPKGGAGSPRTLTVLAPPSLPAYVPPEPGSGGQDPASQDSPQPVQGTLSVSTSALDLTGTGTGTLTLTCAGGDCPWHVVAGGVLGADVRQGTLQDGESVTVALTVDPAALLLGGSKAVTVWPGDIQVQVSWSVPVVPAVDPSALPASVPAVSVSVP